MAVHLEVRLDAQFDAEEIRKAFREGAYGSKEFREVFVPEASEPSCLSLPSTGETMTVLSSAVCLHFNVTVEELGSSVKRRDLVSARAVLARAAQLTPGFGLRPVCDTLGKPQGSVSRLAAKARLDQQLDDLARQFATELFCGPPKV